MDVLIEEWKIRRRIQQMALSLPDMRRTISRLGLPLDRELVKIKANDIIYKNIIKWTY